jgi:hypothetical protein
MPDPVDYLGAPKIITGTDYMHALAALGYNVENMSSPLPTMTKIAEAGTNFLDSIYNQNIKAQQSQADLQYKLAETKNVNAVADWNSRSLDLRLAELDTQNRQREQQISSAEREQPLREKILENQGKTGDLDFQILQRKNDDFTQAQAALPGALQTLPDPEKDPNFKTNFDNWQSTNAGLLARQDSVGDQARRMRDTVKTRYEGTSRFHQSLADVQEFEGYQRKGTINQNYDADKMVFGNPDKAQAELVQARALDAQAELQELLVDPRIPQAYRDKLNDTYTYVHNYVSSKTGVQDIQRGEASLYFNPDGKLNSTARSMIDGVKALREVKPPEISARIPIPGVTGKILKGEEPTEEIKGTQEQVQQQIQDLRKQQAAEKQRTAEMQDVPDTPENLEDKAAHQRGEISLEELHRRVNERMKAKPLSGNRRIPGMQDGGLVQASYTPGSESQMLPGTEPEIPRQVQNAARAEMLLRPGDPNAPYLGGGSLPGPSGRLLSPTDQIDWHNFNFGATQSFSGGPGFYNNPGSGKPFDTGDPALVGARVPMAELTRVLGTDAGSEKSVTSRDVARGMYQVVVAKRDGTLAKFPIVDVTPEGKNRGLELTPAAMKMMDAKPGDNLGYRLAFPDAGKIDPTFGGESPIHNWLRQRDVGRRSRAPGTIALQTGGLVSGTPGPDQVPAMLTSGEYVVNKDAVQDVGLPALEALNAGDQPKFNLASGAQPPVSTGTQQDVQFQQPEQPSAFQQLFGGVPYQSSVDAPRPGQLPNMPVRNQIPVIRPQLAQPIQAPRATPAPAPRAMPAQTPAVATGAATLPIASTGGTTLTPKYTTGDALLNAHYLGDGRLSGLATNFGHDVNGRPDTYMLSKLGGGSRIGAFGADVVNPTTAGVSLPVQTVRAFIGDPSDPQVRQRIQSGRVQVEVTAPNGRTGRFPIVDLGPGKGENASLDMTGTAMRQLGMKDNFGAVYRIVSY